MKNFSLFSPVRGRILVGFFHLLWGCKQLVLFPASTYSATFWHYTVYSLQSRSWKQFFYSGLFVTFKQLASNSPDSYMETWLMSWQCLLQNLNPFEKKCKPHCSQNLNNNYNMKPWLDEKYPSVVLLNQLTPKWNDSQSSVFEFLLLQYVVCVCEGFIKTKSLFKFTFEHCGCPSDNQR